MSVICGKVYPELGKIVMASDSIIVRGDMKENTNYSKMQRINDMIIGGTGYCYELSLMFHFARTHQPLDCTEKDVLDFIVEFCKWKKELNGEFELRNAYLLCYKYKLFVINNIEAREIKDYYAIGAGDPYATAALYLGKEPNEAVKTACDLSCYVAEPIVVDEYKMWN